MPSYRVVLAGIKSEGNVGAIARAMRNFDVEELVLLNPPPLRDEARERAMHAWDVVENARVVSSFEEAIAGCDLVVGTSARIPPGQKVHLRNPVDSRDLAQRLRPAAGKVALCFGREDFGLFNEELERCDILVTVPTADAYRSLNVSHAVAVVLYELRMSQLEGPVKEMRPMDENMKASFWQMFDRLVDNIELPAHKNRQTKIVARRLFGRAVPSAWEFFVFMGVFSESMKRMGIPVPTGTLTPDFQLPADADEALQATFGDSSTSNA